jgi:hypothetical protein
MMVVRSTNQRLMGRPCGSGGGAWMRGLEQYAIAMAEGAVRERIAPESKHLRLERRTGLA